MPRARVVLAAAAPRCRSLFVHVYSPSIIPSIVVFTSVLEGTLILEAQVLTIPVLPRIS